MSESPGGKRGTHGIVRFARLTGKNRRRGGT